MTSAKEKTAIERIRSFDPIANGYDDKPYFVGYSGGKDSDTLRVLFELSGAKHDLVHNHTTVDAPDTVYHIRSIPNIQIEAPATTMWELIVKKGIPPTRLKRYCCEYLKEHGGTGRICCLGVRWSESTSRAKKRGVAELLTSKDENKIILNNDNTDNRKLFENCALKGKKVVNPIIDWLDKDVWYFLGYYGVAVNPLYEMGFTRVGCIGCPMAGLKARLREFEMYPKYKEAYLRTFDRMLKHWAIERESPRTWKSAEEVMAWWLK